MMIESRRRGIAEQMGLENNGSDEEKNMLIKWAHLDGPNLSNIVL